MDGDPPTAIPRTIREPNASRAGPPGPDRQSVSSAAPPRRQTGGVVAPAGAADALGGRRVEPRRRHGRQSRHTARQCTRRQCVTSQTIIKQRQQRRRHSQAKPGKALRGESASRRERFASVGCGLFLAQCNAGDKRNKDAAGTMPSAAAVGRRNNNALRGIDESAEPVRRGTD